MSLSLTKRLDAIDKVLRANTASLKEHSRRCACLEEQLDPLKTAYAEFQAGLRFLKATGVLLSVIVSAVELVRLFWK